MSGQAWQTGAEQPVANFDTGEGIPAWSFKVEGRLLEVRHVDAASLSSVLKRYSGALSLQTKEAVTRRHYASFRR